MTREEIDSSIMEFLTGYYPAITKEEVARIENFFESGLIDSIQFVALVRHIEALAGRRINLESMTLQQLNSLESIREFLKAASGHG